MALVVMLDGDADLTTMWDLRRNTRRNRFEDISISFL